MYRRSSKAFSKEEGQHLRRCSENRWEAPQAELRVAVPAQPHHPVPPRLCGDAQIRARSYTALALPWHHAGLSVCPGGGCASWLAQRGGGCWWVLQASSEPTVAVSCQKSASPAVGTASRSHQDASLHTNPGDSACPTPHVSCLLCPEVYGDPAAAPPQPSLLSPKPALPSRSPAPHHCC